jgi:hypothetical protein
MYGEEGRANDEVDTVYFQMLSRHRPGVNDKVP